MPLHSRENVGRFVVAILTPAARSLLRNQGGTVRLLLVMPTNKADSDLDLSCPRCGGPLSERRGGGEERYSCRPGHVFPVTALLQAHEDGAERGLWAAVRLLQQRAALLRRAAFRLPREAEG